MTDFNYWSFFPLWDEDEEEIRARLDADVNQGVTEGSDQWIDTRPGSFYNIVSQVMVQELARLWDALGNEVPAAAFPATAWGDYLDNHATTFGITRKQPVAASGTVLFSGDEGALLPSGIIVSARQTDPDVAPPEYSTEESGTITNTLSAPTGLNAVAGSSGTLDDDEYFYTVTAINDIGETLESTEDSATTSAGAGAGSVALSWTAVTGATGYRIYRSLTTGNEKLMAETVNNSYTDTGAVTPSSTDPPGSNTTGGKFRASVVASSAGASGNVGIGAIDTIVTPVVGLDSVTNEGVIAGGADEESDEDLRARILLEFQGGTAGNIVDYQRWALAYEGVGRVTVIPVADGPGTVTVIVMDATGGPVSAAVVDGLQEELDPNPGLVGGKAPIGHTVTVTTPDSVTIPIVADLLLETGFSLDGDTGTVALRDAIEEALSDYIDELAAGADVVYNRVMAAFFAVPGVLDVNTLTVDGGTSDVAIGTAPAEVAQLGTVTLT